MVQISPKTKTKNCHSRLDSTSTTVTSTTVTSITVTSISVTSTTRREIMKKQTAIFATLALAGLVGAITATQAQGNIKLKLVEVITSEPRTVVLKEIIKDFETANPGISVELISLPWAESYPKLTNLIQSGQAPDVAEISENWIGLYGSLGALENLEPYLKKFADFKDFNKASLSFGRSYKKTMYFLPYGFYVRGMFYNKTIFKEAKIARAPRTFDDFTKAAEAITKSAPNRYGYCLRGSRGGLDSIFPFMA